MRSFRSALERGHAAERAWVESLRLLGLSVAHGAKIVADKHCKQRGHVETPDALCLFSAEIKERSLTFTGPADYPYDTVFVDDCRGLGMERYKNLIYVYLSRPTGKWVWLTMLDRDATWSEQVTFDRGRGHEVPVLCAPKSALRPADELIGLLFPHLYLQLVDGCTDAFVSGGGETTRVDRYVAKTNPVTDPRAGAHPGENRKRVGKRVKEKR